MRSLYHQALALADIVREILDRLDAIDRRLAVFPIDHEPAASCGDE